MLRLTFAAASLFAIINLGTTCQSHVTCELDEYCTTRQQCAPLSDCTASSAIDASCQARDCQTHAECNVGSQYCDNTGQCFACQACYLAGDGMDGACPQWCRVTSDSPALPSAPGNTEASTGSSSNGTESGVVALIVIAILVVLAALMLAVFKYRKSMLPTKNEGVPLKHVLTLQSQADVAIRRIAMADQAALLSEHPDSAMSTPHLARARANSLKRPSPVTIATRQRSSTMAGRLAPLNRSVKRRQDADAQAEVDRALALFRASYEAASIPSEEAQASQANSSDLLALLNASNLDMAIDQNGLAASSSTIFVEPDDKPVSAPSGHGTPMRVHLTSGDLAAEDIEL